ncbi:hypothetical protein M3M35_07135 [Fructilactobacillus myrtifloralis]|uniref:Uncharacterized protein n=1 Tax=Fructilactobacillus myrtifloralis TaxID=2940301 RepID=A0ABY5BQ54_9LACO|nr:hypothetical protein [Fructilactobacillus myrtifloralis]USS85056.1 hypothetical protein M3M35_07135 [Fructilactobacillus myrtifloralis]
MTEAVHFSLGREVLPEELEKADDTKKFILQLPGGSYVYIQKIDEHHGRINYTLDRDKAEVFTEKDIKSNDQLNGMDSLSDRIYLEDEDD